ncbi:hypothetical protein Droror1_Dr00003056 [Drosera rotundifolia]
MTRLTRLTRPLTPLLSSPHHRILLSPRASLTPRVKLSFQLLSRASSVSPRRPTMDPISDTRHGGGGAAVIEDSAADDYVRVERPSEAVDDDGGNPNSGAKGNEGDEVLLGRNVVTLSCQNVDGEICDVWLIGTAHVSQDSCREVQAIISHLEPEVVFLELCASRVAILSFRDLKIPTMNEMIDMWRKNQNLFGIIYSWFLAKVADKLEVLPGSEFRVAFDEAKKCCSKVILGDRPVQITLRRTWAKMPLWHKIKLVHSFLFQAFFLPNAEDLNRMIKEMDDVDMLTLVIQEMSKKFPTLMETLVDERDRYMSSTLLKVAIQNRSVVAVVGKGHLQGIKKYWKQPIEIDELLEIPSKSTAASAMKILKSVGIAAAGAAVISGIYIAVKKHS